MNIKKDLRIFIKFLKKEHCLYLFDSVQYHTKLNQNKLFTDAFNWVSNLFESNILCRLKLSFNFISSWIFWLEILLSDISTLTIWDGTILFCSTIIPTDDLFSSASLNTLPILSIFELYLNCFICSSVFHNFDKTEQ